MKNILLILGIFTTLCTGCSKDNTTEETQRTSIQSYLSGQQFAYVEQSGVYKYVSNSARANYATAPVFEGEDQALIQFAVSAFTTSGEGTLYFTNIASLIPTDSPLTPQYWEFTPKEISLNDSRLLKGVRLGLEKCRQGDSVQLYLVSDLAYGDKPMGVIPANTPLVWNIIIDSVIKK